MYLMFLGREKIKKAYVVMILCAEAKQNQKYRIELHSTLLT